MSIKIENGQVRYCGTGIDINPESGCHELYIRGEFVCSWEQITNRENLINVAILHAVEYGKKMKASEIRKAIGA